MEQEDIRKIIKKKTLRIAKLASAIDKGFDPEDVHKFRVEVKRLRSFLRLLSANNKEKKIKLPGKFKRLYYICGEIREAQLEQKRMQELKLHFPAYAVHLSAQVKYQRNLWEQTYKKSIAAGLNKKIKDSKPGKLADGKLLLFFKDHCDNIRDLAKGAISDENIHSIRKQVKDMLYNTKFAEEEWKGAYKKIAKLPLKELDKISDSLGAYNDTRIWLDHFESYAPANLGVEEKTAIAELCRKERISLQANKKKILQSVRNLAKNMMAEIAIQ
jgi:CHAD domain-containing protein